MKKTTVTTVLTVLTILISVSVSSSAATYNYNGNNYYGNYGYDNYSYYNNSYNNWLNIEEAFGAESIDSAVGYYISRGDFFTIVGNSLDAGGVLTQRTCYEQFADYNNQLFLRLREASIVLGSDNCSLPYAPITRAEATCIVLRMSKNAGLKSVFGNYNSYSYQNTNRGSFYNDPSMAQNKWYYAEVTEAYQRGIVNGNGKGMFDAETNISGAEAIQLLINVFGNSNNCLVYGVNSVFKLTFKNPVNTNVPPTTSKNKVKELDLDELNESLGISGNNNAYGHKSKPEAPVIDNSQAGTISGGSKTKPEIPALPELDNIPTVDLTTGNNNSYSAPSTSIVDLTGSNSYGVSSNRPPVPVLD